MDVGLTAYWNVEFRYRGFAHGAEAFRPQSRSLALHLLWLYIDSVCGRKAAVPWAKPLVDEWDGDDVFFDMIWPLYGFP